MADIATENYKKSIIRVVDRWGDKMEKIGKELAPILKELSDLSKNKDPSADDKKKIDALRKQAEDLKKKADTAAMELRADLMLLEPAKGADPKETKKLPDWLEQIIKKKGLPLGKDVSVAPDVDFDLKAGKLKKVGLTITIDLP